MCKVSKQVQVFVTKLFYLDSKNILSFMQFFSFELKTYVTLCLVTNYLKAANLLKKLIISYKC